MAFTKTCAAHLIVRVAWVLSFALTWVGLFTQGWYDFAFAGDATSETKAYRDNYKAHYGLFSISFEGPAGTVSTGYTGWALTNAKDPNSYMSIHGSRITAIMATIACILTAAAYYRSSISKTEVSVFTTARMAWLATLDMALNLATLGLWAIVANNPSFLTVCEGEGCFPLPEAQVTTSTISYSWGLWFLRAVFQAFLVGGATYLALSKRSNVNFSTPTSGELSREPSAPSLEVEGSPSKAAAV